MEQNIENIQEKPKINEVNKEATELEALLENKKEVFYQNYIYIQEQVRTSDQSVTHISSMRTYYEEIDDKVSK